MFSPMRFNIDLTLQLPGDPAFLKIFSHLLFFCLGVLFISILARLILGKSSNLNGGIFAGLSILLLYGIAIVLYSLGPEWLDSYLNCLPLGEFDTEEGKKVLKLVTYGDLCFTQLCGEYFKIFLLCYVVCWLNCYTPGNLKTLGWILVRLFFLCVAIGINYGLVHVAGGFLPDVLKKPIVPVILLSILGFSIVIALCKKILTPVQKVVGMLYDGFHNYFFKNKFGTNMVRSVFGTGLVMCFVKVLELIDYSTLDINFGHLSAYFPIAFSLFILWLITSKFQ